MPIANYLFDLPDDIQVIIYKKIFAGCLRQIENKQKNAKTLYDFYDIIAKSKLRYCINGNDALNIYLYRSYYIKEDRNLSKIKYIEYPVSSVSSDFEYIQTIIEEFAAIIYNDDKGDRNLMRLHRSRSGICDLQYTGISFRIFIDKNKLSCRVDLEKAIVLGFELIYYCLKLLLILELNPYDDCDDIRRLTECLYRRRLFEGYVITDDVVQVYLGSGS
jgi:hypothetical protein